MIETVHDIVDVSTAVDYISNGFFGWLLEDKYIIYTILME